MSRILRLESSLLFGYLYTCDCKNAIEDIVDCSRRGFLHHLSKTKREFDVSENQRSVPC